MCTELRWSSLSFRVSHEHHLNRRDAKCLSTRCSDHAHRASISETELKFRFMFDTITVPGSNANLRRAPEYLGAGKLELST